MAIPASHIVRINPRVIAGGSSDLELNGLFFTKCTDIATDNMVLAFTSPATVKDYFGADSPEYGVSLDYFAGYLNKFSAPRKLFFARRVDASVPGWLRGAPLTASLPELKGVANGGLALRIDGKTCALTGLSFSSAVSLSDIAAKIGQALATDTPGTVCTYSSLYKAFQITSPTAGADSEVSYATAPMSGTDLAGLLGFTQDAGAVISSGMDALSVAAQIDAVRQKTENWFSFSTLWEAGDDEHAALAAWASANYGWHYAGWTDNPTTALATSAADPASKQKAANYDHSSMTFGSERHAAFLMGSIASVAWLRVRGTVTFAFKRQAGLPATAIDEAAAAALEAKRCNYMGRFATRNAEFVFYYPGILSASDYGYIDAYANAVWFNNKLQAALMDGLTTVGRTPYTELGYTLIRAWMLDPVAAALNNGAIEPGVNLSELQKSELINEVGHDISEELATHGFYIQILDPGSVVRAERGSPIISIWYTYGGAVQRLDVASTAVL